MRISAAADTSSKLDCKTPQILMDAGTFPSDSLAFYDEQQMIGFDSQVSGFS